MLWVTSANTAISIPAIVVPRPPAPSLRCFTRMRMGDASIPINDHAHPSLSSSLEMSHLHHKPTN